MRNKIYLLALLLLLMHLPTLAQIGGDFNPDNPGDPGTNTVNYTLTVKAVPSEGGSSFTAKLVEGQTYTLRANPSTDYAFVGWVIEGDTIPDNPHNFEMPAHNIEILALYCYDPTNPQNPDPTTLRYQLSLVADPADGGKFNISNEYLTEGSTKTLMATAYTDYVFKQWIIEDSIIPANEDNSLSFTMPAHNVTIIGNFEYYPSNPVNPNANYWNPMTGEVIVDDFTPGKLSDAISSLLSRYNGNKNDVESIIVVGQMKSNDFGIADTYKNCAILDLSRVIGSSEVPSSAFDNTKLESVYLPASIEIIGKNAFYQCTELKTLTVYALMPPSLGENVFTGVPDGLVVYVPADALDLYKADPVWGQFFILPITEGNRNITVYFSSETSPADYTNMRLELTNIKDGRRMHYVISDRNCYRFNNIDRNSSWQVTLTNQYGDEFGLIESIMVGEEDVTVVLPPLKKAYSVKLSVKTPDGQDVTDQARITWLDNRGEIIARGNRISGLPEGRKLTYSFVLPQDLATIYSLPDNRNYIVQDGVNDVVCQLNEITQVHLSGKVMDAAADQPFQGASISVMQSFAAGNTKTITIQTDSQGVYALDIVSAPTTITVSARNYISQTLNCDSLMNTGNAVSLPDIILQPFTGAVIKVDLTYTKAHLPGVDAGTQEWFSDYNNVDYELYNKSTGHAITDFNVQFPRILLMDEVNDGDVLELTATSRKNEFKPVKASVTIVEQKATATFNIVEMGKIEAQFNMNLNPTVAGTLYDANGKLVNSYKYSNATLTITNLNDGEYMLVTMGGSLFYNTINDLSDLPQIGLTEGVDFVQNKVDVQNGLISAIEIDEVPTLDETKFYYTGENTSFTVNKPSIVIGNYLTLTGHLDFKSVYEGMVENVSMIIDIPESCSFVENSVMVENNASAYSVDGNRVTIPLLRYTDRVRLCMIPTIGGTYEPNALAQFDINGETITQPIGSAIFEAKNLSITVPSKVGRTTVRVSGTVGDQCDLDIYDNGVLIKKTESLKNGSWACDCELNNAYQASRHAIHAKVITKEGLELLTEAVNCTYDENHVQVLKVTQYNEQRGPQPYWVTFDYVNPSTSSQHYSYDMTDNHRTFTYTISFADNKAVQDVVLYVKTAHNHWWPLMAAFDEEKDLWVTEGEFGNANDADLPLNVSVDYYDVNYNPLDSATIIGNLRNDYDYKVLEGFCDDNDVMSFSIIPIDRGLSVSMVFTKINNEKKNIFYSLIDDLGFVSIPIENSEFNYYRNESNECLRLIEIADSIYVSGVFNYNSSSFWVYSSALRNNDYDVNKLLFKNNKNLDNMDLPYIRRETDAIGRWIDNQIEVVLEEADRRLACTKPGSVERTMIHYHVQRLRSYVADAGVCRLFPTFSIIIGLPNCTLDHVQSLLSDVVNASIEECLKYDEGEILNDALDAFTTAALTERGHILKYPDCFSDNSRGYPYLGADANYCIDPSGFVYEGVPSNRLQGVTATCYYKETVEDMYGDLHEEVVLWDAEQYSQENPLLTDENGYYRWDVPVGMWQVKYEKEGYETTYSDWLPVPPPQLDVNIGMVQMRQPEVLKAHAYPKAVELEFDKFMLPETLTTDNITVSVNGTAVSGTIELMNAEVDDPNAITSIRRAPGTGLTLASRVRFNADKPFNADQVTLHVKQDVKSYADLMMNEDYEAVLPLELEMQEIVADSVVVVPYLGSKQLTVAVLPAAASAGKVFNVVSTASMIATTDAEQYTLDGNGEAVITIHGDLPGMTSLLYSINGYDLTAATLIDVKMESEMTVATPTASIASGSEVEKGTAVYLYCKTEGATIYYTLDGSCPCDPSDARKVYDGTPVIINGNVTIKAMAVAEGLYDSDVATFIYRVPGLKGDVNGDGTVNISDINQLIDYILRDRINSETLERGDVNGDGTINISDINVVIQIILGSGSGAHAPVNTADLLHMNDLELRPGEMGDLRVTVDNAAQYSAMQCDIVLPDGLTLVGVTPVDGNIGQAGAVDDMTSRALTYSMTKNPFTVGQPVLTLTVRADAALACDSRVSLTNVVLSDADNASWYAEGCTAMVNNASGIIDQTAVVDRVWTEGNTLCISTRQDGAARVIAVNGMMRRMDVGAGVTRLPLEPGIYIVVLNGKSHKVLIK